MLQLSQEVLADFVSRLFIAAGAPADEAAIVAGSLVESNLRGYDSHGVTLARWYLGQIKNGELLPRAPFTVLRETPAFIGADGGLGFGQVQCGRLVDRVAERAREFGVACGTLVRCGHVGRLGEWVERAAVTGLAALIAVNDNGVIRTVAPPGGTQGRISTNPIAIAVPTGKQPLVLDISTSAVANGKLKIARLEQKPVPLGWIQDAQGEPTTDPNVMLADPPGALLPFGGDQNHKGFGLGLLFDILTAGLAGGFCPPGAVRYAGMEQRTARGLEPRTWRRRASFHDRGRQIARSRPRHTTPGGSRTHSASGRSQRRGPRSAIEVRHPDRRGRLGATHARRREAECRGADLATLTSTSAPGSSRCGTSLPCRSAGTCGRRSSHAATATG